MDAEGFTTDRSLFIRGFFPCVLSGLCPLAAQLKPVSLLSRLPIYPSPACNARGSALSIVPANLAARCAHCLSGTLQLKGSERNSESFLRNSGIPSEITICSLYFVFHGNIFCREFPILLGSQLLKTV